MIEISKKRSRILALLTFAAATATMAVAQVTTTIPVGVTTITVPANTSQTISVSLDNLPDFQGVISTRSGTTITTNGVSWTATTFGPYATKPYVVRFLTGASKGRQLKVSANSANSLSVVLPTGVSDVSSLAAEGDAYELLSVDTLASFFGTGSSTVVSTNVDPDLADNILVRTSLSWITFYNDGTQWLRVAGTGSNQDNFALSPELGLLVVRKAATDLTITVTGQVPSTNLISDFNGSANTLFANRFPVDTTLTSLALQNTPNWVSNVDPDLADTVWLRTSLSWIGYYYDGSNWLRIAGTGSPQNPTLKSGSAFLIDRRGTLNVAYNQPLPYTL